MKLRDKAKFHFNKIIMALIISALGAVVSFYVSHLLNGITTEKDDEAKIAGVKQDVNRYMAAFKLYE
mgnify:CR=1 FL=1